MKKISFALIPFIIFSQLVFVQAQPLVTPMQDSVYKNHEELSKIRYAKMQMKFDSCFEKSDINGLTLLSNELDIQMKIEDYRIRFREADHPKYSIYYTVIIPAIVSLCVALIPLLSVRFQRKSPHKNV